MKVFHKRLSHILILLVLLSVVPVEFSSDLGPKLVMAVPLNSTHSLLSDIEAGFSPNIGSCPTTQYSDVVTTDYFYDPVWYLCAYSAVFGYTGTTCQNSGVGSPCYLPYAGTTRADMVRAVVVAQQSDNNNWASVPDVQAFADVIPDGYMSVFIETAAYHGIISGYQCGGPGEPCIPPQNLPYFRPNNIVTRGQAAKIITLSEDWYQVYPYPPTFTDVPTSNPFYTFVETAYYYNLISGYNDSGHCGSNIPCFRPYDSVLRGQTAKFVFRMKQGNFVHDDNYAGSNNWNYQPPPFNPSYMEPRGFLVPSIPAVDIYQGEGRQMGWNSSAVNWMQDPSRTAYVYITMHVFNANSNNCSDQQVVGSYSFTNINNGIAPITKNSCFPAIHDDNEIRFRVDSSWIIPNVTGYIARAAFRDKHILSYGKHEYDITSYYEGTDQYHKDDMRKFCYYHGVIGFTDSSGACHQ